MNNDPENDEVELRQFAAQLADALPKLSAESLARVQQDMDAELNRLERQTTRRRWFLGLSVAASIALAIIGYAVTRPGPSPTPNGSQEPALVHDRVPIVPSQFARAADAGKPVIPVDDYRSLYAD
jgi:hypothetical protein